MSEKDDKISTLFISKAIDAESSMVLPDQIRMDTGQPQALRSFYKSESAQNVYFGNQYHLPPLERVVIICVLEDCMDQMNIISTMGVKCFTPEFKYKSLHQRIKDSKARSQLFHEETIEPTESLKKKERPRKHQQTKMYVERCLLRTSKELKEKSSYNYFVDKVSEIEVMKLEENSLFMEEAENLDKLKKLRAQLRKEYYEKYSIIRHHNIKIAEFRDKLEDTVIDTTVKLQYINRWENARKEQNSLRCEILENDFNNALNKKKQEIDQEMRVHAEIEAHMSQTKQDMEDSIQNWMEKYDEDMERYELENISLRDKREDLYHRMSILVDEFQSHAKEIQDYLVLREKRRQEAILLAQKHAAATRISAWWRGTMVRRGLGPYKAQKKGAKNTKKSAKDK